MVNMTNTGPSTGTPRRRTPAITSELIDLAQKIDRESPQAPQRVFIKALISACREKVGDFNGTPWYRKLIAAAGIARTPSSRTFNATLADLRDGAGEMHGVTNKAIGELGKLVHRIEESVSSLAENAERIAAAHEKILAATQRQVEIAESIQRRQMVFSDQSQAYGRMIEDLKSSFEGELSRFAKIAQNMDGVGLQFTLQANRVTLAVEQLSRNLQEAANSPAK